MSLLHITKTRGKHMGIMCGKSVIAATGICFFSEKMKILILTRVKLKLCQNGVRYMHLTSPSLGTRAVKLSHTIYNHQGRLMGSPPLLMTHGLLGSKTNWGSIAKALAKRTNRQIVVFDARNHGDSPKSEEHDYDLMAEDVLELRDSLDLKGVKFTLLGHSMGGRAAMTVALRFPDVIDKLVVVDVSPMSLQSQFHSEMESYFRTMINLNFDLGRRITLSEARKMGHEALTPVAPDLGIRSFLLTNLTEENGKITWKANLPVLLNALNTIGGRMPADVMTKKYEGPTLIIRGEQSTYVPDSDIPKIKGLFPNADVATIKGAGHWVHATHSAEFLDALVSFLEQR